jgi:PAS domain-containing protein
MRIDGAFRSVRTIAFAIRNQADEISRVAGITQDVTVAKRAEQALRQSRDLYRDLVENSGVLMGTHDEEGRIVSVNQAAVELAGLQTAEQMVGRKISDFLTLDTRELFSC